MLRGLVVLAVILMIPTYLDAQTRIKGRVVDALSGEPVENASVVLAKFDLRVTTDAAGVFVFDDVPAADDETISLHIRHEGFAYR